VTEYLLNAQRKMQGGYYSLAGLARRFYLGNKTLDLDHLNPEDIDPETLRIYNLWDCKLALQIAARQMKRVHELGMYDLYRLKMMEIPVIVDMECNGMKYDVDRSKEYEQRGLGHIAECEESIRSIAAREHAKIHNTGEQDNGAICTDHGSPRTSNEGHNSSNQCTHRRFEHPFEQDFNPGSNEHVSALLFGGNVQCPGREYYTITLKSGEQKEKSRKCTMLRKLPGMFKPQERWALAKDGYFSTSKEVLLLLNPRNKDQKNLLTYLKELSRLQKQVSTYFASLPKKVDNQGYLHPNLNMTVTRTGRYSSSDPNGQNIERKGKSQVKECFTTRY
jgi:DNA polymerase I-like protein with 3'-5' exonuclease and polymerase domains